jgi:hypothetical protein
MIIYDFNVDRPSSSLRPLETNPPLVIDTDTVLAFAVTLERLKMIAGQVQIEQRRGRFELVEFHFRLALNTREGLDRVPFGKPPRSLASEAYDHVSGYPLLCVTSSIIFGLAALAEAQNALVVYAKSPKTPKNLGEFVSEMERFLTRAKAVRQAVRGLSETQAVRGSL